MAAADASGFQPKTLEQVERLLDLLDEMKRHPDLKGELALHGLASESLRFKQPVTNPSGNQGAIKGTTCGFANHLSHSQNCELIRTG